MAIKDTSFLPKVFSALRLLAKSEYMVIIVTNQAGIARGYFTEVELKTLHQWLVESVKKKDGRIDRIYFCPHDDDALCICRKPKPGMLIHAATDLGLNLSQSWMVGDDERDVIAGRMANVRTIKLGRRMSSQERVGPHFHAHDLLEAVRMILRS
ncbi:MAG: D-glycero-D-manno-heptose 1,7-bisphosphate phosphatase [Parcubacteria group bacterium Gr01-1014_66]|nr:MAG: D-glycero-D-manno-heptose 1,7-bisphosphate phosphatase [Parcubacteria group bacterium Gr01-1014_66]